MGWLTPKHIFILSCFEIGWISSVFFQNTIASSVTLTFAAVIFCIDQPSFKKAFALLSISLIGCLNDSVMSYFNIFNFSEKFFLIPIWLISLWFLFISTFNNVLKFLKPKPLYLQALLGGLAGMISYGLGSKIGHIDYSFYIPQLLFHFINWSVLFPVLFNLYHTLVSQ